MSFAVAILGRPNVGKSTLFNRLVGRRLALVDDTPGVTRDRREGEGRIADLEFRVIDTAGLEEAAPASLAGRMQAQTERALADADVALLVIDAREGVTEADRHFADWLRRSGKPVVLSGQQGRRPRGAARHRRGVPARPRRSGAGLGRARRRAWPSSMSGWRRSRGPPNRRPTARGKALQLAIVGRPNVGKSTLVNRLIGEERLLSGPEAGITRDAIADRLDVARPSDPARRHRRAAPQAAGRRQARAALGRRRAARDPVCRNRGPGHGCAAAARAAGSDDRPARRGGGARAGARGKQMGRGR